MKQKSKREVKRSLIHKLIQFSRVFAVKGSVTSEQVQAGNVYLAQKQAKARKVKKIFLAGKKRIK